MPRTKKQLKVDSPWKDVIASLLCAQLPPSARSLLNCPFCFQIKNAFIFGTISGVELYTDNEFNLVLHVHPVQYQNYNVQYIYYSDSEKQWRLCFENTTGEESLPGTLTLLDSK